MPTIRITVGGQTVTGELNDSPTARDLAEQLPVDVTLADFNGVEKVGPLPRPLTMNGVPAGADPEINEIGYYQPTNGLVFYYGDVGYYTGIVRIGRLAAADMQLIQRQTGSFGVTIDKG
ncbi:MAG TPA: cyclophilin-like fold protein [Lapillicoccus sp.]|nr:cyclophilin-like fold protein [Lapillicoccus sp.]